MFSLTKQERLVLFCLALIILCGSTVHYLLKKYPAIQKMLGAIETEALYKRIDINTASAQQFEALPYIGQVTADRLVAYRKQQGGFQTVEQLKDVPGIGPVNYERILPYLKIIK